MAGDDNTVNEICKANQAVIMEVTKELAHCTEAIKGVGGKVDDQSDTIRDHQKENRAAHAELHKRLDGVVSDINDVKTQVVEHRTGIKLFKWALPIIGGALAWLGVQVNFGKDP